MTSRSLSIVWGIALLIVFSVTVTLERVGAREVEDQIKIFGAPVVLIGSSLTREAVPFDPLEGGVLGDGRAHIRLAEPNITERRSLRYLQDAITGGAETIIIEINAFSFDLNGEWLKKAGEEKPKIVPTRFDFVRDFSDRVSLGIKRASGFVDTDYMQSEHDNRLAVYDGVPEDYFQLLFPLELRRPEYSDLLRDQVARAKAEGVEVIFVSPPRSASVEPFLGAEDYAALLARQQEIATEYGVPLIDLGPFWPNDHFRDMTHLNFRGSERFLKEIAEWYETRK